jgi:hypothetical protein
VHEGDGVCPVYCGTTAKESALSYARQRAGYSPTEIQVLDAKWKCCGDYSARGQARSRLKIVATDPGREEAYGTPGIPEFAPRWPPSFRIIT